MESWLLAKSWRALAFSPACAQTKGGRADGWHACLDPSQIHVIRARIGSETSHRAETVPSTYNRKKVFTGSRVPSRNRGYLTRGCSAWVGRVKLGVIPHRCEQGAVRATLREASWSNSLSPKLVADVSDGCDRSEANRYKQSSNLSPLQALCIVLTVRSVMIIS